MHFERGTSKQTIVIHTNKNLFGLVTKPNYFLNIAQIVCAGNDTTQSKNIDTILCQLFVMPNDYAKI